VGSLRSFVAEIDEQRIGGGGIMTKVAHKSVVFVWKVAHKSVDESLRLFI
jgi:hypothetical protein